MIDQSKLVNKSYKYLMNITWERISDGKEYDVNFKPYNKELLKNLIKFFEETEEYEKCAKAQQLLNKKEHENNYEN